MNEKLKLYEKYEKIILALSDSEDEAIGLFYNILDEILAIPNTTCYDAVQLVKTNLGYMSGYYDRELQLKVFDCFKCVHPVFGLTDPTPQEAFNAGIQQNEKPVWCAQPIELPKQSSKTTIDEWLRN